MYAIIRSGGKQTKVKEGDVIHVERLRASGEEVSFTPILVVDDDGNAISAREDLAAITVRARVLGETRGDKIDIFKYKSKSGYRRRQGHRQTYTALEVTGIEVPGAKKAAKKETEKPAAKPEQAPAKSEKPAAQAAPAAAEETEKPAAKAKPAAQAEPAATEETETPPAKAKPAAQAKPAATEETETPPAKAKPAAKAKPPAKAKPAAEAEQVPAEPENPDGAPKKGGGAKVNENPAGSE